MPDQPIIFKYLGHSKGDDGLVRLYHLEATDSRSGRVEAISVGPRHLASVRSMKRILLGRGMFYSATPKAHSEMLMELFDPA